jgi:hypothetical protein
MARAPRYPLGDEKPMSLGDSIQIAPALWVKEAMGVPDLEFLMLDEWITEQATGGRRSVVRLQDYAEKAQANSDGKVAVRLKRVQARFPAQGADRATPSQVVLAPYTSDLYSSLGLTPPATPGTPPRGAPFRTRGVLG